jgi:hypothetical protein
MSVFLRSRSVREVINDTHMTNADEYNAWTILWHKAIFDT